MISVESIDIIHHINRTKDRNHVIITMNPVKISNLTQYCFTIKILNKLGIEENLINLLKNIYKKTTINILLNVKRLNAFLLT